MSLFSRLLQPTAPSHRHGFVVGSLCMVCGQWQDEPICRLCQEHFSSTRARCAACAIRLPILIGQDAKWHAGQCCGACLRESPPFTLAVAAVDYAYPWRQIILAMKHHPAAIGVIPLSTLLAQAVRKAYAWAGPTTAPGTYPVDLIIPVPMAVDRLKARGHNQAWEIARRLGTHLGLPARADMIQRWPGATAQQALHRAARRDNVRSAFHLSTPTSADRLVGRRVALVDDVMTTGATLEALAHTVLAAGAVEVHAWAVARTPA